LPLGDASHTAKRIASPHAGCDDHLRSGRLVPTPPSKTLPFPSLPTFHTSTRFLPPFYAGGGTRAAYRKLTPPAAGARRRPRPFTATNHQHSLLTIVRGLPIRHGIYLPHRQVRYTLATHFLLAALTLAARVSIPLMSLYLPLQTMPRLEP